MALLLFPFRLEILSLGKGFYEGDTGAWTAMDSFSVKLRSPEQERLEPDRIWR